MTEYVINLNQLPNQGFSTNITDKNGTMYSLDIKLRTLRNGLLIMDLAVDGIEQFYGRACVNKIPMLWHNKLNGNIYFEDQYGIEDPEYRGFNDRFLLIYNDEYVL